VRNHIFLLLIAVFCLVSCSPNKTQLSTEAKLKNADELFAKKNIPVLQLSMKRFLLNANQLLLLMLR